MKLIMPAVAALFLISLVSLDTSAQTTAPTTQPRKMAIRVVDADPGEPVAAATVVCRSDWKARDAKTTDADGRCVIALHGEHEWERIECSRDGYVAMQGTWQWHADSAEAAAGHSTADVPREYEMKLPRGRKIGGRIVDDAGAPVAAAVVHIDLQPSRVERETIWPYYRPSYEDTSVTSDGDGRWSCDRVPRDGSNVAVRVEHDDFVMISARTNEAAEFTLTRGVRLRGRVTGADGKPVAGATVSTQETYYVVNDFHPTNKTDADGRYRLAALRPGPITVTVFAKGHGPALARTDLKPGATLDVQLPEPRKMEGQVVDGDGAPIASAYMRSQDWRGQSSLPLETNTDANGRFTINDAPDDAVVFQVGADGYEYAGDAKLKAGEPNKITLHALPIIRGDVVDAGTGKPIDRFRLVQRCDRPGKFPVWFDYMNDPLDLRGGRFDRRLQMNSSGASAGYVRIEADGYRPTVFGPLRGKGPHELHARLEPAPATVGHIVDASGNAVADADVYLLFDGMQLNLVDNKVDGRTSVTHTDKQGRFTFRPQSGRFWLLAIGLAGWEITETDSSAFVSGDPRFTIALRPWSHIEGSWTMTTGDAKRSGILVYVNPLRDVKDHITPLVLWYFSASMDADGKFKLDRVPDFHGQPCTVLLDGSVGEVEDRRWLPTVLQADETAHVTVSSADGAAVAGRAQPASKEDDFGSTARGWAVLAKRATRSAADAPDSLIDAGREAAPVYRAGVRADGSFTFAGIPSGEYEVSVTLSAGASGYATGSGCANIAEHATNVQLDPIIYRRLGSATPGAPAPREWGKRFDESSISIDEFKDRWSVLVVWDSCSGTAEDALPALDALAKEYATDKRVALVSLNQDRVSCGMIGVPVKPTTLEHPAWQRGYISLADQSVVSALGARELPHIVIIDPHGNFAAVAVAPASLAATLAELMRNQR